MGNNLKPCPVCRENAAVTYMTLIGSKFGVFCEGCDAEGPRCASYEAAVRGWNERRWIEPKAEVP